MSQTIPLAIIGFGEVGSLFSRQFLARGTFRSPPGT